MEAKSPLVRSKCIIKLDTIAVIDMNPILIINPLYFELDDPIRSYLTFQNRIRLKTGVTVNNRFKRMENFTDRLHKGVIYRASGFFEIG